MNGEKEWQRAARPRARRPARGRMDAVHSAPARQVPARAGDAASRRAWRAWATRAGNRAVQRLASDAEFVAPEHVERAIEGQRGGGRPLEPTVRGPMESALGADLSGVRVHDDAQAAELNQQLSARAFTHGGDIFFGAGEYAPASGEGQRLLAHELAHVVQQRDGARLIVGAANDPAEREADAVAQAALARLTLLNRQPEGEEEEEEVQALRREEGLGLDEELQELRRQATPAEEEEEEEQAQARRVR